MSRIPLRPAPLALAIAMALSGASLHAQDTSGALSSSTAVQFRIAAKPLGQALSDWALHTQAQLIVQPALVSGKVAPALDGKLTPRQALDQILVGSGLVAVPDGNAVVIKMAPTAGEAATLAAVTVTAQAERSATSEGTRTYAARAATLTGIEQSLKDIPQSVSVVTRQRLEDQNLSTFDDVVASTPGVTRQFVNSGQSGYFSRGFNSARMLADGMQTVGTYDGILGLAPDTATLDRVEVLRGAAGLQMGAGAPGATVNMVRKRPLAEKQVELLARVGSWGYKRGELDATGPLNESGTLRGRAVIAYEDKDFFYDRASSKVPLIYGIVEADIGSATTLAAGLRYQSYDQDGVYMFRGLPVSSDGSDLGLPRSYATGPSWSRYKSETKELFSELRHRFTNDWTGKLAVNLQRAFVNEAYISRPYAGVDPLTYQQTGSGTPVAVDAQYEFDRHALDANLQGHLDFLGYRQELRFGASLIEETRDYSASTYTYAGQKFDASNPYYEGFIQPTFSRVPTAGLKTKNSSLYGNSVIQVTDALKLNFGGRLSWYEATNYNGSGVVTSVSKQSQEFTPFAGLVYALTPSWSAYASYADIFEPQSTYATAGGQALDPAIGSNYELGIKGEVLDRRATVSAAVFRIEQTGRAAIDTNYPTGGCPGQPASNLCYVNGGKVRSQGFELEAAGELIRGLQASAAYTYTDAIYLRDRDAYGQPTTNEGNQFNVIPRHTIRLFATYDVPVAGWTVGGGADIQSHTVGKDYSGIERHMPGRTVWEGFARYRIDKGTTVALNIKNLLDKRYYNDEYGYRYGEPRKIQVTLRTRF